MKTLEQKTPRYKTLSILLFTAVIHSACTTVDAPPKRTSIPPPSKPHVSIFMTPDANAFANLKKSAEKGDPHAQALLSVRYEKGQGCEPDNVQALYWLQKSATQGYPPAQTVLALKYLRGTLVENDPETAAAWLEKAARQEYPHAEYMLASLYREGKGVPKDDERAMFWYTRAAEAGYAPARQAIQAWNATEASGTGTDGHQLKQPETEVFESMGEGEVQTRGVELPVVTME